MGFLKFLFGDNNEAGKKGILDEEFEIKPVYGWSEFYPDFCEDMYVEEIIKNGSKIVIDCEVKNDDVASAIAGLGEDDYREKIFNDLCEAGLPITDSLLIALDNEVGSEYPYEQVLGMLRPPYQVEAILSILDRLGETTETFDLEHYINNRKGRFSYDQVRSIHESFPDLSEDVLEDILSDIRDSLTFKQVITILEEMPDLSAHSKELLLMDIKGEPKYRFIEDIFNLIDKNMYSLMNVYVAKLKQKEQEELHDTYDF